MDPLPNEILYSILYYISAPERHKLSIVSKTFKLLISLFSTEPKFIKELNLADILKRKTRKFTKIYCCDDWIIIPTKSHKGFYINRYCSTNIPKPRQTITHNSETWYIGNISINYKTEYDPYYHALISIKTPFHKVYHLEYIVRRTFPSVKLTKRQNSIDLYTTTINKSYYKQKWNHDYNLNLTDEYDVHPIGYVYDNLNNVYLIDWKTNTIKKFDPSGIFVLKFTMVNNTDLIHIIKLDPLNRLYIATQYIIQVFNIHGNYLFQIKYKFNKIKSLTFDSRGNLIVLDKNLLFFDI